MGRQFIEGNVAFMTLARSPDSGDKVMPDVVGTNLTCYEEDDVSAFMFSGGEINLTNMAGGDTVITEVHKIIEDGGAYVLESQVTYNGIQAVPLKTIAAIANLYGIRVRARQTAGVVRTFYMEFFESKR